MFLDAILPISVAGLLDQPHDPFAAQCLGDLLRGRWLSIFGVVEIDVIEVKAMRSHRCTNASGDSIPPAVWFAYTPDRKGEHPQAHLANFSGILQADAYAGFNAIYEGGQVLEAACWAHAHRKFYDLHAARPSALTTEALRRVGELYAIEEGMRGKPPDERRTARQQHAKPLLDDLERWLYGTLATLSRKSDTAAAILYSLKLWPALTRYCDDGRIEIDNSAPSAPCVAWPWAVATSCLQVQTVAANALPPCMD